ncbi:MAG: Ig-like domain-containing protein, partial [Verrucomicrobiota bacterium]
VTNSASLAVNQNILISGAPLNQTNCPGTTANFSVNASGTGLSYQWFRGPNPLPGRTNSTLILPGVTAANAGSYSVVVSGTCGTPVTNSASLTVNESVFVTTAPVSQTNCPGTAANFSVSASGTGLSYQWYRGTNVFVGQTNSVLFVPEVTATSAGLYSVVVSGACGTPVTNSAVLARYESVSIATPPSDQSSFVGSNATFTVQANGTGLNYQWTRNGQQVGTGTNLVVNNLTTNSAGSYCIVVSGLCGSPVTNCANLTILNRAPAGTGEFYTVLEDQSLNTVSPGVLANDLDLDGDSLSAILVSTTSNGQLTLNSNGSFSYTPNQNFNGADSFTYKASDGNLVSSTVTVAITVSPVNDAPAFTAGPNLPVNQNSGAQTYPGWATGISAGPVDEVGQILAFQLNNDNPSLFSAQPGIAADGTLSFDLALNMAGRAVVSAVLKDNGGTANGGVDTSAVQTFEITVNGPPTVNIFTPTNQAVFVVGQPVTIVADAADPDGSVTLVQFFSGTNLLGSVTNGPFFVVWTNAPAGVFQLTAVATDNSGLSATSSVVTITLIEKLPLTFAGPITLNRQTGLFEQRVRLSNPTPATIEAARVLVYNLPTGVRVYNATGTNNGVPFVQYNSAILPGGLAELIIEYVVPSRIAPTNVLLITEIVQTLTPVVINGTPQKIDLFVRLLDKSYLMQFKTLQNRIYVVQYSSDLVNWKTSVPSINGTGTTVQWIDNGAPRTESAPSITEKRFYKIILLP